ncbi:MAG: AAA family ATPase [Gammaproteobacteria bacterium]|jgi:aminoglycoside phosphotransferase family enzyme/predicted kinase
MAIDMPATDRQKILLEALQVPGICAGPGETVRVLETHISWVILAGEYAWKLKKAVNFGFLDFSTLEKRRHYCEEELRLNRRFAPDLYLEVVPITGRAENPSLGGDGAVIEYAVKMRRFPQEGLLSTIAGDKQLQAAQVDMIADLVAGMHGQVAVAGEDSAYGLPDDIHHWMGENFEQIRPHLHTATQRQVPETLEKWCAREYQARHDDMVRRRANGFVRECHGDLHLGNLALIDGRIVPFDCIEFNPKLRWIDVMSEAAFLVMDLRERGYPGLAQRFLNTYLQHTGDYAGIRLLRYYLVYRALVRAKVAILRLAQVGSTRDETAAWNEYTGYMRLAAQYAKAPPPALVITHGLSGSGKSWYASRLVELLGALQLRSDSERKRLYGYDPDADTASGAHTGIYTAAASARTYTRLAELARDLISGGYPVIVDAAFLKFAERERFRRLAAELDVPFVLLHFEADRDILRRRIGARRAAGTDPSEADVSVLELQLDSREPLQAGERERMITVDTGTGYPVEWLARQLSTMTGLAVA